MSTLTLPDGTPLELRRYVERDLPMVRDLHRRAVAALAAERHDHDQINAHIQLIDSPGYAEDLGASHMHLAFDGGGLLVATAGWMANGDGRARLRKLFVLPSLARRGVGTALIRWVEADAQEHGFARFTVRANLNAVELYEKAGYRPEGPGVLETPAGIDLPTVIMGKG